MQKNRNSSDTPSICMLSTGHGPLDDRLYYKETMSLEHRYSNIWLIAPGERRDFNGNLKTRYVPLGSCDSLAARCFAAMKAVRAAMRLKADVCHIHDYELIFALPLIKLLTKSKIIYDAYELYPEMVQQSEKIPNALKPGVSWLVDVCERSLARLADQIITADDDISLRFRGLHRHVTTLFNYPDLSLFVPDDKKTAELQLRYRGRIPVIYHGSMSIPRGLFQLIEGMRILKQKKPEIVLLLIGSMGGDLLRKVQDIIRRDGLSEQIELIGTVPHREIVNYISISKIGIIPFQPTAKLKKNIPTKQFEYMACGVPVLGADLPPITSYVVPAGCGRVYDSTRPEALAQGVLDILDDEREWKRMADAGKRAVRDRWNWDEMKNRLLLVYERVLGTCKEKESGGLIAEAREK